MKYLFDTNIISELYKPVPNPFFLTWFDGIDSSLMYISAVSIGEIRCGIEMKRKRHPESVGKLVRNLEILEKLYEGKVLPFGQEAAHIWGQITASYPNNPIDAQIASIAIVHQAIIVTRDNDFIDLASKIVHLGISFQLINPFEIKH